MQGETMTDPPNPASSIDSIFEQYGRVHTGERPPDKDELLAQYQRSLIIVPGDKVEFEELAGYPVELVDLGGPNKGALIVYMEGFRSYEGFESHVVGYTKERFLSGGEPVVKEKRSYRTPLDLLVERRVVGIIHATLTQSDWSSRWDRGTERIYYGLPVRKMTEEKTR